MKKKLPFSALLHSISSKILIHQSIWNKSKLVLFSFIFLLISNVVHSQIIVETFEESAYANTAMNATNTTGYTVTSTNGALIACTNSSFLPYNINVAATAASQSITLYTSNNSTTKSVSTNAPASTSNWIWYLWGTASVTTGTNLGGGAGGGAPIPHSQSKCIRLGSQGGYLATPIITNGISQVTFWSGQGSIAVGLKTVFTGSVLSGNTSFPMSAMPATYNNAAGHPMNVSVMFSNNSSNYSAGTTSGSYAQFTYTVPATLASKPLQLAFWYNGATVSVDDIVITSPITTPTIALADNSGGQVAAGNIGKNTNDNIIYNFQTAITGTNATINTVSFTTTGTATSGTDITNFKLYFNNTSNSFAGASQIGTSITTGLGAGSHSFSSLTQQINVSTTGYFWITADIPSGATSNNTIAVSAMPASNLTFASGTASGTPTAGGTQTIVAPAIALADNSGGQIAAGNIAQNSINQIVYNFQTAVTLAGTTLNTVNFTTTGTAASGTDITNFKLYYSATNVFGNATQIGSTITTGLGAGSHSFSSLTQSIASGATGYFWITADIPSGATVNNTIAVSAFTSGNVAFAAGTVTGSTSAGGTQTIAVVPATVTLANNTNGQVAVGNITRGFPNNIIYNFQTTIATTNAIINTVNFSTTGTATSGTDITNFKLYYSATNSFGSATQIGTSITTGLGAGSHSFTGLTQSIAQNTSGYFWITTDIPSGATVNNNLAVSAFTSSNLVFASGNVSGSTTAGGTQTIIAAVSAASDYYRSNVASGDWSAPATWQSSPDSINWITATMIPGTGAKVSILSGHNITFSSTTGANPLRITVESGGTFTNNAASTANLIVSNNFNVKSNGTYVHNPTSSTSNGAATDFPGATRTFDAASTVQITKWANGGTTPAALPTIPSPGWGNLTINVSTLAGNWNQAGTLTAVQGNLIIQATGGSGRVFQLLTSQTATVAIGGSLQMTGGTLSLDNANSNTGAITLNIAGDLVVDGASSLIYLDEVVSDNTVTTINVNGTASGTTGKVEIKNGGQINVPSGDCGGNTITTAGDFIISGASTFGWRNGAGNTGPAYTLNIGGSYNQTGGTFTGSSPSDKAFVNFTGTNPASVSYTQSAGTPLSSRTSYTVASNRTLSLNNGIAITNGGTTVTFVVSGTLDCKTSAISGGGNFTLNAGATLKTSNTSGITSSITTTGTKTFTAGANYEFDAATTTPFGGNTYGNPNNVTINANVSLDKAINVTTATATPSLTLTSGILTTTASNLLTITNASNAAISGGSSTSYINGPATWTLGTTSTGTYTVPLGVSGTGYFPFAFVAGSIASGTPSINVQAFASAPGTADGTTLSSTSTTEYWKMITTGATFSATSFSIGRSNPASLGSLNAIGKSTSNGVTSFSSIGGSVGTLSGQNAVVSSSSGLTGASTLYLALAQTPVITVGTLSPSSVSTTYGTPSSNASFVVSGSGILTGGITITPPSAAFQVSLDGTNFSNSVNINSTGTIANTTVYVRLTATAAVNSYSGNINLTATGATPKTVAIASSAVSQAALTITANDKTKTYGQTITGSSGSTAFTFSSLQNGETIGTVTIAYGMGSAGNDPVSGSPYNTVVASSATGGTFNPNNYNITYNPGNIIISKATLTITADNKNVNYGDATPSLTYTPSGFVNSENSSVLSGAPSLNTTYTSSTLPSASPVAITISAGTLTAANYNFSFVNGSIIIAAGSSHIWTGSVSSNWSTAGNWDDNTAPVSGEDETIASGSANYPVLSGNTTIGSLSLQSGASLDIGSNLLTINGAVSGAGTLTGSSTSDLTLGGSGGSLRFTTNSQIIRTFTLGSSTNATLASPLSIASTGSVAITNGGVLNTNDQLTLKSDANGTAYVTSNTSGSTYISGSVTVERYIQPNGGTRAWRLLSVPTQSNQTINNAWQEGQTGGANNGSGYGTIITAANNLSTWANEGFDFQQQDASMLTYNMSTNTWDNVTTTNGNTPTNNPANGKLATKNGYFLYVRGNRSETPAPIPAGTTIATLRSAGSLYEGNVEVYGNSTSLIPAGKFALIGNVYASPVDFTVMTKNNIDDVFYVWDPKIHLGSSLGAYQTFSKTTSTQWAPLIPLGSYTPGVPNTLIQTGQAFFVHSTPGAGAVTLTEGSKTTGYKDVFRPEGIGGQLTTDLYEGSAANLSDVTVSVFNNNYSDAVDANDAIKLSNNGTNMGILRDGKILSIEGRQQISSSDTIYYNMWNLQAQQYKFSFVPSGLNAAGLTAYLQDSYLGTSTPVDLNSGTSISFTVDNNVASSRSDRFRLIFNNSTPVPVTYTNVKAYQQNNNVALEWSVANQSSVKEYVVEKSSDGVIFTTVAVIEAANINTYDWIDANAISGDNYYRIRSVGVNGLVQYSSTVKVKIGTGAPAIAVYPNPIRGGVIGLQLTNMDKGKYGIHLVDNLGQVLMTTEMQHAGGSANQTIRVSGLAKGVYHLEVNGPNNYKNDIKVMY